MRILFAVAAICLVGIPMKAAAQNRTETIVSSGDAAPDGNGSFAGVASAMPVHLSETGQALFYSNLSGTSGGASDDFGLFLGNGISIQQIARDGDAAPDGNGVISLPSIGLNGAGAIRAVNGSGDVGFYSNLTSTAGSNLDDSGIFRGSGAAITQIAREGQTAPDGNGEFSSFTYGGVADSGQVAFSANLRNTAGGVNDNSGVFLGSSGSIVQIARAGDPTPDGAGQFQSFSGVSTTNSAGQVGFDAFLNLINRGVYIGHAGGIVQVAIDGQAAPDGIGTLFYPVGSRINEVGQRAVFAQLAGTSGGSSDNLAIFRGNGGALTQMARRGQLAPGGNGTLDTFQSQSILLNNKGQVVFDANLANTIGGSSDNRGLFRSNGPVLTELARKGHTAPDGNGAFSSFSDLLINDAGQTLFESNLSGTAGGSSDNAGLFTSDGIDRIQVVRKGEAMSGSTISSIHHSNLNQHGQVAYSASLANGTGLVNVWTPELHWRDANSSWAGWDTSAAWTLSLTPGEPHDVFLAPAASRSILGPATNTTVRSLQVGGGTGVATFDLRNGAVLTSVNGVTIESTGVLTGDGTIAGNITNLGTMELENLNVNSTVTNQGVIEGDGRLTINGSLVNSGVIRGNAKIDARVTNQASGQIRVAAGDRMRISGTDLNNLGVIESVGGEIEVDAPATNQRNTGLVTARNATLRFNQGLVNDGSIGVSYGTSDIHGDVNNTATGTINVSGGGNVTFYDDLTQNGTMVVAKVGNTTSSAVLFGDFSGAGGFVGGGDVFFFGDLRPGNSPASVLFDGSAYLGPTTDSLFELGGLGTGQFDQLRVTGDLGIDGNLSVSLINGFQLTFNDQFLIADVDGALAGEFYGLAEGDLVGNFGGMDLFITYAGGSGNDVSLFTAVPEAPAGLLLGVVALGGVVCRRRQLLALSRIRRVSAVTASLLLVVVPASFAAAQLPVYEVNVTFPGGPGASSSNTPGLFEIGSGVSGNLYGDWFAQANQGQLSTMAQLNAYGSFPVPQGFSSRAGFTYDDLVFSSPMAQIDPVLNLHLDGLFSLDPPSIYGEYGGVIVTATLNGQQRSGSVYGYANSSSGILGGLGATGIIDDVITASFSNIPTNQPVDLTLWLWSTASAGDGAFGNGHGYALSDFDLSFVTGSPVFTVPVGTTVDSPQAGIANNVYMVPEPSIWSVLLLAATAVVVGRRWRRQSSRARP